MPDCFLLITSGERAGERMIRRRRDRHRPRRRGCGRGRRRPPLAAACPPEKGRRRRVADHRPRIEQRDPCQRPARHRYADARAGRRARPGTDDLRGSVRGRWPVARRAGGCTRVFSPARRWHRRPAVGDAPVRGPQARVAARRDDDRSPGRKRRRGLFRRRVPSSCADLRAGRPPLRRRPRISERHVPERRAPRRRGAVPEPGRLHRSRGRRPSLRRRCRDARGDHGDARGARCARGEAILPPRLTAHSRT